MEKISGIYIFKNKINNKVYIGQSVNIYKRVKEHKYKGSIFHKAINKYGWENFYYEILEECDANILNEKEEFYIKKYNSNNKDYGYNILETATDNPIPAGSQRSDEVKNKISNVLKEHYKKYGHTSLGKKHKEESIKKMSETKKNMEVYKGKNNPFYGKTHTKESIDKMMENLMKTVENTDYSHMYKSVIQLDKITKKTIKIWDCISDAVEKLTGNRKTNTRINSACKTGKTALGYCWKYKETE